IMLKKTESNGQTTPSPMSPYVEEGRRGEYMGHKVNFEPTEYMLFVKNKDVPGVIGHIGNVLGDFGINISTMQVSPNKNDGTALMIVSTDREIPDEAVESLNKLNSIIKARAVRG
ncbi:MAG TPA: phosphoglycerate dehydrogenase, partial [Thermoanaerobacter sp.]|nr:phosphoglycerate dehydrogenase [Thermoanaerobacter sp.]